MSDALGDLSVAATVEGIHSGQLSASERIDSALQRIEKRNPTVHAFIEVWAEEARAAARQLDADRDKQQLPLAGVPVALKDNLCFEGHVAAAGSRILRDWVSPYSATAVRRLLDAGAIPVGRANMDEFAMGSSTENSSLGPTDNPVAPGRVPGGSSGGPAAAVAAGMVPCALGSDTGGSVRQPASFCGIVGLKPTYGRVSRYGLIAFASSLDQIGPLCGDVADSAHVLKAIAGHDRRDATSLDEPVEDYPGLLADSDAPLRLGVASDWKGEGIDSAVADRFDRTLEGLAERGIEIRTIELPHARYAVATYYVIATAEASSNLARYDGVRYGHRATDAESPVEMLRRSRNEGFGAEVKRRILLGTFVLSAGYHDQYYGRAQRVRTLVCRDFDAAFAGVDAIIGPTSPTVAFELGARTADPLAMYLSDIYTVPANLAGLPAISLPARHGDDSLPMGIQLVGPRLTESRLLQIAHRIEAILGS